ncbi:hypothetical protein LTR94_027783, partial [Friedmanniomyces endolithicus]
RRFRSRLGRERRPGGGGLSRPGLRPGADGHADAGHGRPVRRAGNPSARGGHGPAARSRGHADRQRPGPTSGRGPGRRRRPPYGQALQRRRPSGHGLGPDGTDASGRGSRGL